MGRAGKAPREAVGRPRNLPNSAHGFLRGCLEAWALGLGPRLFKCGLYGTGFEASLRYCVRGCRAMAAQDRFADKGRIGMTQRTLRSILAGGALVAALTLAGPAPAHAAAGPGLAGLWSWLAGSWGDRVSVLRLGEGHAQGYRSPTETRKPEKAGPCIDPNGCANTQTSGPSSAPCTTRDAGPCIDPNG
jgi:hypothetical protein